MFEVFNEIHKPNAINPDSCFDLYIDSHADHRRARVVWYNQKSRNEVRITRLGGASSALLDSEATGALTVFSFGPSNVNVGRECHVWVCDSAIEEDLLIDVIGWVEPGSFCYVGRKGLLDLTQGVSEYQFIIENVPADWLDSFPTTNDFCNKVVELRPFDGLAADERLVRRRECEYVLFQAVEEAVNLPIVKRGFSSLGEFESLAQQMLQRRRSRSGRSLELHIRQIFLEEGLCEGADFDYNTESESGKHPDFVFPSKACYDDPNYPSERLLMLAVKTTARDRWRQVCHEADRISSKHLLTLQRGVSEVQFSQMKDAGIQLVVPSSLTASYPSSFRSELTTLESFIGDVRLLKLNATK